MFIQAKAMPYHPTLLATATPTARESYFCSGSFSPPDSVSQTPANRHNAPVLRNGDVIPIFDPEDTKVRHTLLGRMPPSLIDIAQNADPQAFRVHKTTQHAFQALCFIDDRRIQSGHVLLEKQDNGVRITALKSGPDILGTHYGLWYCRRQAWLALKPEKQASAVIEAGQRFAIGTIFYDAGGLPHLKEALVFELGTDLNQLTIIDGAAAALSKPKSPSLFGRILAKVRHFFKGSSPEPAQEPKLDTLT